MRGCPNSSSRSSVDLRCALEDTTAILMWLDSFYLGFALSFFGESDVKVVPFLVGARGDFSEERGLE